MPTRNRKKNIKRIIKRKRITKRKRRTKPLRLLIVGGETKDEIQKHLLADLEKLPLNDEDGKRLKDLIVNSTYDYKNKMKVQLFMHPNTGNLYQKQGSSASDLYESGDFIINIYEKDASWLENIRKQLRSTDSMLANILNKCNDWACLSNHNPPLIAKEEIAIVDDRSMTIPKKS